MFAFAKIPFSLGFGVLFEGVGVLTGCDPSLGLGTECPLHINKRLLGKINVWANWLKMPLHLKWFLFFTSSLSSSLSLPLLLFPSGNYFHKSFSALWVAPFYKWRLSLFNRAGFAIHVKAYNVEGMTLPTHLQDPLRFKAPFAWSYGPRLRPTRARTRWSGFSILSRLHTGKIN